MDVCAKRLEEPFILGGQINLPISIMENMAMEGFFCKLLTCPFASE
jgi:hypothetical protein